MAYIDGEEILHNAFSLQKRSRIVASVKLAYSLVDDIIAHQDFLNWLVGYDSIAILRNVAVEFQLSRLTKDQKMNMSYAVRENKKKNCHHIEVYSDNCVLTVSHVHAKDALPREADFRNSLSLNNQQSLFYSIPDPTADEKYYTILTHGNIMTARSQMPNFISIGLPAPDVKKWDTLIEITKQPLFTIVPEEIITESLSLEFTEYVRSQEKDIKQKVDGVE